MQKATISADIVKSTSLSKEEIVSLQRHLCLFIDTLEQHFHGAWGRIVRGDGVECVVPNVKNALRVALMLKCHVKAFGADLKKRSVKSAPHAKFSRYGVRIAIGIGTLRTNDGALGVIDGEAIYRSGRALDGMSPRMRSNLIIVAGKDGRIRLVQAVVNLLDELLTHATAKQCQAVYLRLCGKEEYEIGALLGISQQAVNTHLRKAGWYAIENALHAYEEVMS